MIRCCKIGDRVEFVGGKGVVKAGFMMASSSQPDEGDLFLSVDLDPEYCGYIDRANGSQTYVSRLIVHSSNAEVISK